MSKPEKNLRQKIASWLMLSIIGFLIYMYYPENHFALQYQAAIDCQRINQVHAVATLVERYHAKQGYYPLSKNNSTDAPQLISVIISDKALPRSYSIRPPPEIQGILLLPALFDQELERVLGEEVTLPYDPQTNFAWEKRFYLYKTTEDGHYSVTGTLFSKTEQTQQVAKRQHHYQVGSKASKGDKIQRFHDIETKERTCQKP